MNFILQTLADPQSGSLPTLSEIQTKGGGFFSHPIIGPLFYLIALVFLAALVFNIIRFFLKRSFNLPPSLKRVVLLVALPKEKPKEGEEEQEANVQEMIDQSEAWYSTIGGMRAQRDLQALLRGRQDIFSLELVAHQGLISFYVVVPRYLQAYMEEQIHAQFPKAHIEEVPDYNIFTPESKAAATTLVFRKPYIFPIKTYRLLDVDPLSSLTNVLSKTGPGEGICIQYVCRSAKAQWHNWGARAARKIHEGKTVKEAIGYSGLIGFLTGFYRLFFPKKKNELETGPNPVSAKDEEIAKSLEEKTSRAGLDVNIRIVVSGQTQERARTILKNIVDSFSQYTLYEYGNGFKRDDPFNKDKLIRKYIYRLFDERKKIILNTEEIASLYHFPLTITQTPNIRWLEARKGPVPVNLPKEGILLGENVYRGVKTPVRIKREDRRRHVYIIGMTGTGKSVLMQEMAKQDIKNGEGVCVVDPHGSLIEEIIPSIPKERAEDVIIFDPSDTERPVGLNMLEAQNEEEADFAVQEMIAIFYKLFPPEMIGPMFEHNMRNVMLTLIADKEYPGTIADIPRMFTDKKFQEYKLSKLTDPVVRSFWEKEMAKTSDFHKSEMLGYLISKVGRFVENQMMRNIIGQSKSGFNFREVMDKQKILLVNLSKGKTGEVNSSLLGLIIVSKLQMAALARANIPESERNDFYLYVDEFQNFITDSIATILSEARKYKLNLTVAHQYINQLVEKGDPKIRDAVLGNIGTLISFRIGVEDAEIIARQLAPVFSEYDLANIPRFNAYVRLLVDNSATRAFNISTYPPSAGDPALAEKIKSLSRMKYGRARAEIHQEILERTRLGESAEPPRPPLGENRI